MCSSAAPYTRRARHEIFLSLHVHSRTFLHDAVIHHQVSMLARKLRACLQRMGRRADVPPIMMPTTCVSV